MDLRAWWYKVLRLEHLEVKTLQEDSYGFNSLSFTIPEIFISSEPKAATNTTVTRRRAVISLLLRKYAYG
jgi:hypothetical protein